MLALPFEALPPAVARPPRFDAATPAFRAKAPSLADGDPLLLVVGAARSGTTWLAKIIDSHPETLYRHEPDILIDNDALPAICRSDETFALRAAARAHLDALVASDHLRTVGPLPFFPKAYRDWRDTARRHGRIVMLRALETLGAYRQITYARVPDFVSRGAKPHVFVKSVSATGRAAAYLAAAPNLRIVYLLRHPCGQIASRLRGIELGKFSRPLRLDPILRADAAITARLDAARLDRLSPLEACAWNWAITQEHAIAQLADHPRVMILRYEDLCAEPFAMARQVFAFAGLEWNAQTARFIARSTHRWGRDRFYQVRAETAEVVDRWRSELAPAMQRDIAAIVRPFAVSRFYDLPA
jgi:sulfotransferase family protein